MSTSVLLDALYHTLSSPSIIVSFVFNFIHVITHLYIKATFTQNYCDVLFKQRRYRVSGGTRAVSGEQKKVNAFQL
jgi:hypothetical protein